MATKTRGELYAGGRWSDHGWTATAGMGVGTQSTVPSDDYRFVISLKYLFSGTREASAPTAPVAPVTQSSQNERVSDVIAVNQAAPRTQERIQLDREVLFRHDSSELLPSAKQLLDHIASTLEKPGQEFHELRIEGHTNELGSDQYNLGLSKRRAAAVKDYLLTRGISADQLESEGYGKRRPKPGSEKLPYEERLRVNRRVEFVVER